jgi:hypothetical protein
MLTPASRVEGSDGAAKGRNAIDPTVRSGFRIPNKPLRPEGLTRIHVGPSDLAIISKS